MRSAPSPALSLFLRPPLYCYYHVSQQAPRSALFGAGNIGRGFIAPLLVQSNYVVTFADVNKTTIDRINRERGCYDVHILDSTTDGPKTQEVNRCRGVLSTTDAIYDELADPKCKLITTAGLKRRREIGSGPVNVIACENAIGASSQLEQHVLKHLDADDKAYLAEFVGFANCSVDRIVPPFDPKTFDGHIESSLDVGVESFFEWAVDTSVLKPAQALEFPVEGMTVTDNLPSYNERKLFTLNCGHAITAYLGYLKGYSTIAESVADAEIVRHASFDETYHAKYIDTILRRFANEAVKDDVSRVGRQPLRKLGKQDRLVGPARLCLEAGIPIPNLAVGIAAALLYDNDDDEQSVEMRKAIDDNGLEAYLVQLTGFDKGGEACQQREWFRRTNSLSRIQQEVYPMSLKLKPRPFFQVLEECSAPETYDATTTTTTTTTTTQPMSTQPRAVHFGAGNIGRGFIAPLLVKSGYHVTFADVDKEVIDTIEHDHAYEVHILDSTQDGPSVQEVELVEGVLSNTDDIYDELVNPALKLVTTAVGPAILERIAPTIANGLKKRRELGAGTINIIACENAIGASAQLAQHVQKRLDGDDKMYVAQHVGFANCSVDRIVPPFDPKTFDGHVESSLDVGVESFFEWVVDSDALKPAKALEVPVGGMTLTSDLPAYNERKLFTLNCGHAITAYLGYLKGYSTIAESIADEDIVSVVRGALREESGRALCQRHQNFDEGQHAKYIDTILRRFANEAVKDDVARVGRQPLRKLGKQDRLIGPARLCLELDIPIPNLARGIAAALLYVNDEDEQSVEMRKGMEDKGLEMYVVELTDFEPGGEACRLVLDAYKGLEAAYVKA
ncbi:Mannitol dehydrogenase domain-containing protein [Mycena kentingensis (nom. inval.)]|nr:Mannitol dehydrogenase domain-containing protein [Mycena kentingensis (nom. inval.)]